MIKKKVNRPSLFSSLADMLDQSHPLYRLADNINIMLAAAAYNFKRAMRLLLRLARALGLWQGTLHFTATLPLVCPFTVYSENTK